LSISDVTLNEDLQLPDSSPAVAVENISDVTLNEDSLPDSSPPEKFTVGEWVVARFQHYANPTVFSNYVAQIIEIYEDEGELRVNCMRYKKTKEHDGFVYTFPNVRDDPLIKKCDIVCKLPEPVKWQRCLRFTIHKNGL